MKWVSGIMAALLLAGAAAAQQPTNTVEAIPPGGADLSPAVGPEDLRDFSLGNDQPQARPQNPPTAQPARPPQQQSAPPPASRPAPSEPAPTSRPAPAPSAPPPSIIESPVPQGQVEPEVIDRSGATETLSPLPPISESPIDAADQPTRTLRLPGESASEETPWWPWALGLAVLLGGVFVLARQRQRKAANGMAFEAPTAQPDTAPSAKPAATAPTPPTSAPAPVKQKSPPEFAIDFAPIRASLSETDFVIDYALTLSNKGEAMARDVSIDVAMVMAGYEQEERIEKFVAHPPAERTVAVQALNSFGQAPLRGSVRLTGEELTALNVEGRQLILPTLVFLPRHREGKADPIRFVVGRKPQGSDKLAPMRADMGPRVWRDLEARRA